MVGIELNRWNFQKDEWETRIYLSTSKLNPTILRTKSKKASLYYVNGKYKVKIVTIFNGLLTLKSKQTAIVETENELEVYIHF